MSNVTKLGLLLTTIFILGCSKQDPLISLISKSSLAPKIETQGPYNLNDSHFSSPYTISGQCSSDVEDLQIKLNGNWQSIATALPSSDSNCEDKNFKLAFTLDELGFTLSTYESKNIWLKTISGSDSSEAIEFLINYQDTAPPPSNNASTPTINSINYVNNTEVVVTWALALDHNNEKLIFNLANGASSTPNCGSGLEITLSDASGTTTLKAGTNNIPNFDLNVDDIKIVACGRDSNSYTSQATEKIYYKTPQPPTATINSTNIEIIVSNIVSSGATGYSLVYDLSGAGLQSCPPTAAFTVDNQNITGLTPETNYSVRVCAYNSNPLPEFSFNDYTDVWTMKSQPDPPTLSIVRSTSSEQIKILSLDPSLKYHFDIRTNPNNLVTDHNMASNKDITAVSELPFSTTNNNKYYIRAWVTDTTAYPNTSNFSDFSEWSHIKLLPRNITNSKTWGYQITNTMDNPHKMSNFTNTCDHGAMTHPNKCVNAGLLWHVEIPGATACSDYKVQAINPITSLKVPFLWHCEQKSTFGDFQIIGVKETFNLKSLTTVSGFSPLTIKLLNRGFQTEISKSLGNQELWTNTFIEVNSSTAQIFYDSITYKNKVLIVTASHTGPLTLDGLSNVTLITNGNNFDTNIGENIIINNSTNINLEVNVSNSGTYHPVKINNSKNIIFNQSNIHSSSKGVDIIDSEFIQFQNTKVMNITGSTALTINESNQIYLTNSKISNSGGINYDLSSTYTKTPSINLSQSTIAGTPDTSSAIDIYNQANYPLTSNLNHLTFRHNGFDSIYVNSQKNYFNLNQLLTEGLDSSVTYTGPDNDGLFLSYSDPSSSFYYFSQMGFTNHKENLILKHATGSTSPQSYFFNNYLDSDNHNTCELVDINSSPYGQCTPYGGLLNNHLFGDFFNPSNSKTNLVDSDWINTDRFNYWLEGITSCTSSATCTLYSSVLNRSTSTIIDASKDFSSSRSNNIYQTSGPFDSQPNCEQTLTLEGKYKDAQGEKYYLANAAEINTDMIGNNNGFCESFEICIASPNLGAYQGHLGSNELEVCKLNNNTPNTLSVDVYAYPFNGKL